MILQIALVLLIFTFFFLTYMVSKNWRWLHVLSLVAMFFTAIAFMFFAAFTLRTQAAWRTIVNDQTAKLEEELQTMQELKFGADDDIKQLQSSIQRAKVELAKAVIDRGRVWRSCSVLNAELVPANQHAVVTLEIPARDALAPAAAPPADPDNPDAPAPAPAAQGTRHLISEGMVLFGFVEREVDVIPLPLNLPYYYVGAYLVKSATPLNITLESMQPVGDYEKNFIRPGSKWSLYEVLPTDGHSHFVDLDEQGLKELMSPERTGLGPNDPRYTDMIQEYVRDQKPAADNDLPERKWVMAEFLRNFTVKVDSPTPKLEKNFDFSGQAENIQLYQGDDTAFEIGDTVLMSSESFDKLEKDGVVKKQSEVYVRKLNDYQYIFSQAQRRLAELKQTAEGTELDLATAKETTEKIKVQIAYRQQEKAKLTEDLAHLKNEEAKLLAYMGKVKSFGSALFNRKTALYRDISSKETELAEIQASLAALIEERARRAVAEVGTSGRNP